MISRKEQLLQLPWEIQRFETHRFKVQNARPAIDVRSPPVYSHVVNKRKQIQNEMERLDKIKKENVRLLQKLCEIMGTKRLKNIWTHPRPNFLHRERIFPSRPITCKERTSKSIPKPEDRNMAVAERCRTCLRRSYNKIDVISEERIPWEPPSKSWNYKITTKQFEFLRGGRHCYTYHQ